MAKAKETEPTKEAAPAKEAGPTKFEKEMCELFKFGKCDEEQVAALKVASKLAKASPEVMLAAVLLGMTSIPE